MIPSETDNRSPERRVLDEQIANEPQRAPLELSGDVSPMPMEAHLARSRRPVAVAGVVENGMVRLLDPTIKLSEQARVIVVASEGA